MSACRLVVVVAVVLALAGVAAPASAAPYDAPIDLTFPVAGENHYTDTYRACRSGCSRVHKATDVMVQRIGQPVHAAVGGVVTWITGTNGSPPWYGYMLTVRGDDGRKYNYVHLGTQSGGPSRAYAPGIRDGSRVERGQLIGYAGCSGNASCSGPHLHFSIEDPGVRDPWGGNYRNPYRSLREAEARGDVPGADASAAGFDGGPVPLVGDWDGDGTDTPGWFTDGVFRLSNVTDGSRVDHEFGYGRAGDVPVVGDWDGDGTDTVGIVRDGTWHLVNSHRDGRADISFTYGRVAQGDWPLVGDWDGDGVDTVGIVRDGTWHLIDSHRGGSSDHSFEYGRISRGDMPVVGDWNGSGADTPGVRRDATWFLSYRLGGGAADRSLTYGQARDVPVTGDWDGDGDDSVGVVRDGRDWYLRNLNESGSADRHASFAS